ncbi:MAG: hypothetical protein HZB67_05090 [Candidatus Aenigmarchaeota archaeon]|nr:hypothetical protein [Candidatus Aenigmarchaeota archaeon]
MVLCPYCKKAQLEKGVGGWFFLVFGNFYTDYVCPNCGEKMNIEDLADKIRKHSKG